MGSERFDKNLRCGCLKKSGPFQGPYATRLLTQWPLLNRERESFATEIRTCGRDPRGCVRTPKVLSGNREHKEVGRRVANPRQNDPEMPNARPPISGRRALTGVSAGFVAEKQAPRKQPSS